MKLKCLLAMLLLTSLSCNNTPAVEDKIDSLPHSEPGKTLIAYFLWSRHIQTVANIIHELIGCGMMEIGPEEPYSDEYDEVVDRFKDEGDDHILPVLRTKVENMDDYNTLTIGSPIWGGLLSPPIKSFLSGHDLSGGRMLPFYTHGGSGTAQSVDNIHELCPHAEVLLFMAVELQTLGMK